MDWARAIERNREALKLIVAALFAMLGVAGGATLARIPRGLHTAVLRLLRPAESATRRLVVIMARDLVVKLRPARPLPAGLGGKGGRQRHSFELVDPRKRFEPSHGGTVTRSFPRIHIFTEDPRVAALWRAPAPVAGPAPLPDDGIEAAHLLARLEALKGALEDLPRQARRLVRWRARREKLPGPKFISPLRPGPPPGRQKVSSHPVDDVLAECHWLAFEAAKFDTS